MRKGLSLVAVVVAHPGHREVLRRLIAAFGNEIQELIGAVDHVEAARVAGVGMENRSVRRLEKNAQSRRLGAEIAAFGIVIDNFAAEAVLFGEGNAEITIEVVP